MTHSRITCVSCLLKVYLGLMEPLDRMGHQDAMVIMVVPIHGKILGRFHSKLYYCLGTDGRPGLPGSSGLSGQRGLEGTPGGRGPAGDAGDGGINSEGYKGDRGVSGGSGPLGFPGYAGIPGQAGTRGDSGDSVSHWYLAISYSFQVLCIFKYCI